MRLWDAPCSLGIRCILLKVHFLLKEYVHPYYTGNKEVLSAGLFIRKNATHNILFAWFYIHVSPLFTQVRLSLSNSKLLFCPSCCFLSDSFSLSRVLFILLQEVLLYTYIQQNQCLTFNRDALRVQQICLRSRRDSYESKFGKFISLFCFSLVKFNIFSWN